jgi:DNA-binding response OmpR family regulator
LIPGDEVRFGGMEVDVMNLRCRRPLILVVDEDERLASVLRGVLAPEGFGVVNVADGRAALEKVRAMHEPPRLIILEPNGPGMPGSALLEKLASEARFAGIPVVLLSREPRDLGIPSGNVVANFGKPLPAEELKSLVKKHAVSSRGGVVPAATPRSG